MNKDIAKYKFFESVRLFPTSEKQKKKDWVHYKTQIEIRKNKFRVRKSIREPLWGKKFICIHKKITNQT